MSFYDEILTARHEEDDEEYGDVGGYNSGSVEEDYEEEEVSLLRGKRAPPKRRNPIRGPPRRRPRSPQKSLQKRPLKRA